MNHNFLLNILRAKANFIQLQLPYWKAAKAKEWEEAVPGTKKGEEAFKEYTKSRNELIKLRADLRKTNEAIKALKNSRKAVK